jgi:hypothetical protein
LSSVYVLDLTMVAKKAAKNTQDRSDPKKNKSLAIRNVLNKLPNAKASEVVAAVKKEYGHDVGPSQIYMVKTKTNMAADRKESPIASAGDWVSAIKIARELLKATGSVANATALLKALDS